MKGSNGRANASANAFEPSANQRGMQSSLHAQPFIPDLGASSSSPSPRGDVRGSNPYSLANSAGTSMCSRPVSYFNLTARRFYTDQCSRFSKHLQEAHGPQSSPRKHLNNPWILLNELNNICICSCSIWGCKQQQYKAVIGSSECRTICPR